MLPAQSIDGLIYCRDCAEQVKQQFKVKKQDIKQEKKEIVQERDVIEKEMDVISQEDTQHILLTTTDAVEGRIIINYIDIISVQDIKFQVIHIDPVQDDIQKELAENKLRSSVELNLSKLRKRAYLVGADAVVGICIDSSVAHQRESEYSVSVMIKICVTGTAVRLAEPVQDV
jgi:uncharacterized protein YbjQ (UPF0145 family)